jgi:hypothetical protein
MVVADFHDELRLERLPGILFALIPPARTARRGAREAGRGDQFLKLLRECWTFSGSDGGRKADVMQQAVIIVETQQDRADNLAFAAVAKAPDNTVRAAKAFDLLHPVALAGAVFGRAASR